MRGALRDFCGTVSRVRHRPFALDCANSSACERVSVDLMVLEQGSVTSDIAILALCGSTRSAPSELTAPREPHHVVARKTSVFSGGRDSIEVAGVLAGVSRKIVQRKCCNSRCHRQSFNSGRGRQTTQALADFFSSLCGCSSNVSLTAGAPPSMTRSFGCSPNTRDVTRSATDAMPDCSECAYTSSTSVERE